MPGKGSDGTSFEDMSHEQMLAWLDRANAGTVQAAADRLVAAAKEIRKIAEELKVRPQWVEWKGEGADAFRTWTGDLANATLRLGDFSEDSATWLSRASDAIVTAQASIPRDKPGAQANLDAATEAHNDPDAATVAHKSTTELAALAADKEKVRQEAAAQMTKLGQSYDLSATQLDNLERPKFPPPPKAIAPPEANRRGDRSDAGRQSDTGQVAAATTRPDSVALGSGEASEASRGVHSGVTSRGESLAEIPVAADSLPPTHMDIDSTPVLPQATHPAEGAQSNLPDTGQTHGRVSPAVGEVPPAFGGSTRLPAGPAGPGRATATGRSPLLPGQGGAGANLGRGPGSTGVVGGRPGVGPVGRPLGAIPRGTVVGAEGTTTRNPVGRAGGPGPVGQTLGRQTQAPGRRVPNGGALGGKSQQQRPVVGRPSAPVGSGSDGKPAGARGGISGGTPNSTLSGQRNSTGARPAQPKSPPRTEGRREQPRRRDGDGQARQKDGRHVVPPVID
ncbi:translation initiation factor IF-2 [Streptomyces sp. NPDC008313]|uniref:translation initiation factor IF-2 n=1 Tax=Streptomyces sp. NPDC008313 TaxID=3364826 RepID=UPI0036E08F37